MRVFETHLPGVGRRYTLRFPSGGEFVVVLGDDGTRTTYWRSESGADGEELFEITESQARKVAEIFDGTYLHPVGPGLEEAFEDARIRWLAVEDDSRLANTRIRETGLRTHTGVSILAVQREDHTLSNPDADTEIRSGDTLVVVGTEAAYDTLDDYLAGDA